MDNIVGRLQSDFSPHQIGVIIGSLLGDARLECRSKGMRYPISARLRIHQSDKQKEYVFWKYTALQNLVLKEPRYVRVWHDPKRNKNHFSWYFHTKTMPELGELYHYFYKDDVKVFPQDIEHIITKEMLAIWFMDDGSNVKTGFTISTHCFKMSDQLRVVNLLKNKFSIAANVVKDRTKYKIYIGSESRTAFVDLIKPFIIPSMTYKIVNPRNDLVSTHVEPELIDVKLSSVS